MIVPSLQHLDLVVLVGRPLAQVLNQPVLAVCFCKLLVRQLSAHRLHFHLFQLRLVVSEVPAVLLINVFEDPIAQLLFSLFLIVDCIVLHR